MGFPVKVYQNPTSVIFGEMTTLHIKIIWLVFSYNLTIIKILSGDPKITRIIFLKKMFDSVLKLESLLKSNSHLSAFVSMFHCWKYFCHLYFSVYILSNNCSIFSFNDVSKTFRFQVIFHIRAQKISYGWTLKAMWGGAFL